MKFLPSTVKSLVPEPILSIVQSVLPLGSIAGDEIAKVTFTFLSAVLPPSDQALVPHLNPQSSGSGKSFGIISKVKIVCCQKLFGIHSITILYVTSEQVKLLQNCLDLLDWTSWT